jgi:hypothetical protein
MRLTTYTRSEIELVPAMSEILVKIMAEFLCVLALATKWMKEGRLSKSVLSWSVVGLTCGRKICKETTRGQRCPVSVTEARQAHPGGVSGDSCTEFGGHLWSR